MKAAAFDYCKPSTIEQALALLAQHGLDARIMAGGQTLLATLNMRLSDPKLLIDITGLPGLSSIERRGDRLYIGALATHTQVEESALVAEAAPMLASAAPHIAHRAIRNSGTWGGSIAYGDPAAEWPCCLVALDGHVHVQGPRGQ
ncbi:MAG: FAD binding domain-containing protein, partial [Burkholderiales bacterium]|nr:FAD binding domain-containing protein [Burkholderiales bacterium]